MQQTPPPQGGELSTVLKIVSFCFPLVGAILYFVKKDQEPVAAKSACMMAIWGVAAIILINIILTVAGIGLSGMMGN